MLTRTQAKQIDDIERDRNPWECLRGFSGCAHSLLNETESKEIAEAENLRNLLALEATSAFGICNTSLLMPSEADKVAKLEKQGEPAAL